MSGTKKGKKAKGYIPGDARGNFFRAWRGTPEPTPPYTVNPDHLRLFLILQCFGAPLRPQGQQVRFHTCTELVQMARQLLDWPAPTKGQDSKTALLSAKRQMRSICAELGIKLKEDRIGRPRGAGKGGRS